MGFCNATFSVISISVCGQTHFYNDYPNERKKKVPTSLTSYTADVFRLSHNSPDYMKNCTKFILSLPPRPPSWFPSNKWKSNPNASGKYTG